jgi:hypothetical protein
MHRERYKFPPSFGWEASKEEATLRNRCRSEDGFEMDLQERGNGGMD